MTNEQFNNNKDETISWFNEFTLRLRRFVRNAVLLSMVPLSGWVYHQQAVKQAVIEATRATEAKAYGQFGVEVFTLATILVGEAKGQVEEWPDIASAFFARVDDPRWPSDIEHVAKQKCEIDALCDRVPEYLNSEIGQQAIVYAKEVLSAYYAGEFIPTHGGHSWATPKAAAGHAYFEGLEVVAEGIGHQYFGDKTLAPLHSIRPLSRPQSSFLSEQSGKKIDEVVAVIAKP